MSRSKSNHMWIIIFFQIKTLFLRGKALVSVLVVQKCKWSIGGWITWCLLLEQDKFALTNTLYKLYLLHLLLWASAVVWTLFTTQFYKNLALRCFVITRPSFVLFPKWVQYPCVSEDRETISHNCETTFYHCDVYSHQSSFPQPVYLSFPPFIPIQMTRFASQPVPLRLMSTSDSH